LNESPLWRFDAGGRASVASGAKAPQKCSSVSTGRVVQMTAGSSCFSPVLYLANQRDPWVYVAHYVLIVTGQSNCQGHP
jgi:hypothetical protein